MEFCYLLLVIGHYLLLRVDFFRTHHVPPERLRGLENHFARHMREKVIFWVPNKVDKLVLLG